MKKFLVKYDFVDIHTGKVIFSGETIEADDERTERLKAAGVIGKEVTQEENDGDDSEKKAGSKKGRGKEKAEAALKAGDPDGTQTDNGADGGTDNPGGSESAS